MQRRDRLTYDVELRRAPALSGVSPRLIALLAVVVVLAAVLMIWTATTAGSSPRSSNEPAHAQPALGSSSSASTAPRPTVSPTVATGSDARSSDRAPVGSRTAASEFVAAWLDQTPKSRKIELQKTATSALAEELMLTSTANIPDAQASGSPQLADASEYSTQFVQRLSDGMRIRVYLVADPQSKYGWVATSVEQA